MSASTALVCGVLTTVIIGMMIDILYRKRRIAKFDSLLKESQAQVQALADRSAYLESDEYQKVIQKFQESARESLLETDQPLLWNLKRPLLAWKLTKENQAEVMAWCGGTSWSPAPLRQVQGVCFNGLDDDDDDDIVGARFGDYLVETEDTFEVYDAEAFEASYQVVADQVTYALAG